MRIRPTNIRIIGNEKGDDFQLKQWIMAELRGGVAAPPIRCTSRLDDLF